MSSFPLYEGGNEALAEDRIGISRPTRLAWNHQKSGKPSFDPTEKWERKAISSPIVQIKR